MTPNKAKNSFGIPFLRTGPRQLVAILNQIIAALDAVRVVQGGEVTPTGTLIRPGQAVATSRAASAPFLHPFRVSLVNPDTPTAAISASSRLYKSISPTDTQAITALTTAFTLASNTCVWIEVTVSALVVTAAERKAGTAWPAFIVTSGSPAAQTQFNIPVGRVVATDPTKPGFEFPITAADVTTFYHFEQCLFSHLLVESRCNSGVSILYGFPWSGAA